MIEFEWDYQKEVSNIKKHHVSFLEAVESFSDPQGVLLEDKDHSGDEVRFYWIGKSKEGKILTTRLTRRDQLIRIIGSAQWRKFRRLYETTKIG